MALEAFPHYCIVEVYKIGNKDCWKIIPYHPQMPFWVRITDSHSRLMEILTELNTLHPTEKVFDPSRNRYITIYRNKA